MFSTKRAVKSQQNPDLRITTFEQFAKDAQANGFTRFFKNLKPKNDGAPTLGFANNTDEVILITLGKPVGKALAEGVIKEQDLLGLQVIDGKNAKGEERYYLALDGRTYFSVEEVIKTANKVREMRAKRANITDVSSLLTA